MELQKPITYSETQAWEYQLKPYNTGSSLQAQIDGLCEFLKGLLC